MSRTCPNCDKNLPAGVELATCPFCFKNLLVVPPSNENQPFGRTLNEDDLEVDLSPVEGVPELTLDLDSSTGQPFGSLAVDSDASGPKDAGSDAESPKAQNLWGGGTLEANDEGAGGTLVDPASDRPVVYAGTGSKSGDMGSNDGGTVLASQPEDSSQSDGNETAELPSHFVGGSSAEQGTIDHSSDSHVPAHEQWKLIAGSSRNPMHTVKAERLDGKASSYDSLDLPVKERNIAFDASPVDLDADYQLLEQVGKGAMGVVHKAKQYSIDRMVAFKMIQKQSEQRPESRRKFLREAQITGSLDHPNIVPIHDLGVSEDGSVFYSMKLVEGTEWKDVIKDKTRDENLEILLKVCDAVGFAHSRDVIHRDLKPENVMLGQFGEVLVMDWGLAINLLRDRGRGFNLGGTPAYMAPEMAWHDKDRIGPCSDIYLLGAMLYQVITGSPPHPGKSVTDCVEAAKRNAIIPLKDPDDPLAKIALKAMGAEPADRYETVLDFQEAIREYRRNSESVALTHRAETALAEAMEKKDYEQYAKAMFGFNDAIEIWPENAPAIAGAEKARLEYGRCAVERTDYDLALQVLKEDVEVERPLYQKALAGKREALAKEKRIRRLTGAVLATVSLALVGALFGYGQLASKNTQLAAKTEEAEASAKEAIAQKLIADEALEEAERKRVEADKATVFANEEKAKADIARSDAEQSATDAEEQRKKAVASAEEAFEAQKAAEAAEADAVAQKERAEEARKEAIAAQLAELAGSRYTLFQSYQPTLNLAAVRLQKQQDVTSSRNLLAEVRNLESKLNKQFDEQANKVIDNDTGVDMSALTVPTPLLKNWAYRRVELLGNGEFPSTSISGNDRITCMHGVSKLGRIAIGSIAGTITVFDVVNGQMETVASQQFDPEAEVVSVALSPSGDTVAYCTTKGSFVWPIGQGQAQPATLPQVPLDADKVSYASNKGKTILMVSKGEYLMNWETDATGMPLKMVAAKPENFKGEIQQLIESQVDGQGFAVFRDQNGTYQRLQFAADGTQGLRLDFPPQTPPLTSVQFTGKDQLIAGTRDGELLAFQIEGDGLGLVASLTGTYDRLAARAIAVSPDAKRMIVVAKDAPGMQLWNATGPGAADWKFVRPMLGHDASLQVIGVRFLDAGKRAVSVDEKGKTILWDLDEFELKQRIDNRPLISPPLTSGLVSDGKTDSLNVNLTIDQRGVLDRWELGADGEPRGWQYAGHAPGATLVDVALTPDGKRMITAAELIDSQLDPNPYYVGLQGKTLKRQFCLWDVDGRKLIHRWEDDKDGIPTVQINGTGTSVFIGGNQNDAIVDFVFEDGRYVSKSMKPVAFPANQWAINSAGGDIALVTDSGAVMTYQSGNNHETVMEIAKSYVDGKKTKAATWSPDGQVLFLVQEGTIQAVPRDAPPTERFYSTSGSVPERISDPKDVDALSSIVDGKLMVFLNIRADGGTSYFEFEVVAAQGVSGKELKLATSKNFPQKTLWLLGQGVGNRPLQLDKATLGGSKISKPKIVRATPDASRAVIFDQDANFCVMDLQQGVAIEFHHAIRKPCVAASIAPLSGADWRAITADTDGDLWFAVPGANPAGVMVDWMPLETDLEAVKSVEFSDSGQYIAVVGRNRKSKTMGVDLWEMGADGVPVHIRFVEGPTSAAWHSIKDELVGWIPASSMLVRIDVDGSTTKIISTKSIQENGLTVQPVAFFRESFSADGVQPKWYVVLGTTSENQGSGDALSSYDSIYLTSYEPKEVNADESPFININATGVTSVYASPTENLLALGNNKGTVSLWMAAPALNTEATFEIFGFEDHRGGAICSLHFGSDGNTFVSADQTGRQYAWLSASLKQDN